MIKTLVDAQCVFHSNTTVLGLKFSQFTVMQKKYLFSLFLTICLQVNALI